MTAAALTLLLAAGPGELELTVQLDTGAKDGIGVRAVTPAEGEAFATSIATLDAVAGASWKAPVMTVALKPGAALKFTDLKRASTSAQLPDGGHLQVVFNLLKLEGEVTLALSVEQNADRLPAALKGATKAKEVVETPDGWRFTIPKGRSVAVVPLIKTLAAKTGVPYRIFSILRNITWHTPAEETE